MIKTFFPVKMSANQLVAIIVAGYAFFSILPYATAGRYVFSGLMLLTFLVSVFSRKIKWPGFLWLNLSLFTLVGTVLASSFNAIDPVESFALFKKDTIPFLIGFLLLTLRNMNNVERYQSIWINIAAVLSAFALRTIAALYVDFDTGFRFSFYKESPELPRYLDFYAADSLYFAPILLAVILFGDIGKWVRGVLVLIFTLMLFEVIVSGVRTTFVLVSLSILILLTAKFWRYRTYIGMGIVVVLITAYVAKDYVSNPTLARYYTLVDPKTYRFGEDFSVSERTAIANGVIQIAEKRPWFGYGPGWKKLPTVAEHLGLLDQWRVSDKPLDQMKYNYFSLGEGRVNPHNFYLALYFELGICGVLAYLSFLLAVGVAAVKTLMQKPEATGSVVALAAFCYVLVYLLAGFAGGPFLPAVLLVLASSLSLMQQNSWSRQIT